MKFARVCKVHRAHKDYRDFYRKNMSEKPPKKPILSVITVCYNEKNVERTCKSIADQSFQDFEWIVIDGGSSPDTLKVFEKYKKRIDVFVSEKDTGVYNAMNKGIARALGKWLNFMNAGDTFENDTVLERIFAGFSKVANSKGFEADVLYGKSRSFDKNGTSTLQKFSFKHKLNHTFWQSNCLNHQACFFKRELFEKFGPYEEEYKIRADFEKMLLFLKEGCNFSDLKIVVSNFYTDGLSSSNTETLQAETDEIMAKYFPLEYKTLHTIKFLGKIPIARVKERRDGKNRRLVFLKTTLLEWEC